MNKVGIAVVLLTAVAAGAQSKPADGAGCTRLVSLAVKNVVVESATVVARGAFQQPGTEKPGPRVVRIYADTPAMCRVIAHSRPSADSDIKIEIWLPMSGWNGRLQGMGTGGFAGYFPYPNMAQAVTRGYAAASTDTGHTGGDNADWALGHPEKVVDYGHRGIHEMTAFAKAALTSFYGRPPQHAYFVGCSNGGRQALMEAQRYPEDYDGILAGAPANNWTHLLTDALWSMQAMGSDPQSYIPAKKWKSVASAVNSACDAKDDVKDGVLNDPRECHFDPATIQCKAGANDDSCLTEKQVVALKKIYDGPRDAHGQRVFWGLLPGAETGGGGWESWVSGKELGDSIGFFFGKQFFTNMVYQDHAWDYRTANLEAAAKAADEKTGRALNAVDPDLSRLAKHGGKLVLYHGWNDPAIPAMSTVEYYEHVKKKMGAGANGVVRLYMVPGMQHCGGGPGATSFGQDANSAPLDAEHNLYTALEQWVEKGVAPGTVIASKEKPPMTRPLCQYPQKAVYKGSGDTNLAENFKCEK